MNKSDMPKYSITPSKGLLVYFLFLSTGIVFGSIATGPISLFIFGASFESIQVVLNNISDYPQYFHHLMALNTISMVLILFFPSLIFLKIFEGSIINYNLNEEKKINYFLLCLLATLLVFTVQPIVSWAGQLNEMLVLPEFLHGLELIAAETDAKYKKIFLLIRGMDSIRDLILLTLFICVAPAVIEELVFRGIIQKLLVKVFPNKHLGVWVAGLLFSLMHMSLYGFLPRLLLGALLGYIYLHSGKLIISVFTHFVNNLLVILILFYIPMHENNLENPPLLATVLATISLICVGYYFIRLTLKDLTIE